MRRAIGALAGGLLLTSIAPGAHAYVVKRTSRGDLVHWEEAKVAYTIDPSVDENVNGASGAIFTSMGSWSGTVGAPELTGRAASAATSAPTGPGFDEKNGVFFMKDGYAPAGRALAITVLTYDNTSGRILDADVIFNGSYAFKVLAPPSGSTKTFVDDSTHVANTDAVDHDDDRVVPARQAVYDLHHVVAHELGHSLGMNDEMGERDALMYRFSAPNDASIRQPGSDAKRWSGAKNPSVEYPQ